MNQPYQAKQSLDAMSDVEKVWLNRLAQASFVLSARGLSQCPLDTGGEVALVGRSNAGKSSLLNALCGRASLAKTAKRPGKTAALNYFDISLEQLPCRLVDLPGYGYARVSKVERATWDKLISRYLESRMSLVGLWVIMDIRHPLTPLDQIIVRWALEAQLSVHLILNKVDKLGYGASQKTLSEVARRLVEMYPHQAGGQITLQTFSAKAPKPKQLSGLCLWLEEHLSGSQELLLDESQPEL